MVRTPTVSLSSDSLADPGQLRIKELKLRNVPLEKVLQYICDATRLRYRLDDHAVLLLPLEALECDDLMTRSFVVHPDFFELLLGNGEDNTINRPSPIELLKQQGVSFPHRSFANYIKHTNTLIVRNTYDNLDIIEQIIESIRSSGSGGGGESMDDPFAGRASLVASKSDMEDPFGDIGIDGLLPASDDDSILHAAPAPFVAPEADDLLTHIWAESNYYKSSHSNSKPTIEPNQFWIDFIEYEGDQGFLSARFTECTDSTSSMLIALALLDLPFKGEKPEAHIDRLTLNVKARSPMLLFYRDTRETQKVADSTPLLVRRNFFRLGDRTRVDDQGRQIENTITGEFLAGVPYVSSLIITNPTGTPRELQVLSQIPRGAIPLNGQAATQARDIKLAAHATQRLEYRFYFPHAGSFPHFPAHVMEHDIVQASAVQANQTSPIKVIEHARQKDTRSWHAVARDGSDAEVLARLQTANLHRTPFEPILWRLQTNRQKINT